MLPSHRVFTLTARRATARAPDATLSARRGLLAGTRVDTTRGWRLVESVMPGDWVHGQDGRPRQVLRVDRVRHVGRREVESLRRVVLIPAGVLGCCAPFVVLPEQHLFLAAPRARRTLMAEGALVPGRVLAGHFGIVPFLLSAPTEVVTLCLESEDTVWVNTGLLAHCPAADAAEAPPAGGRYLVLDGRGAEALIALSKPRSPPAGDPIRSLRACLPRRLKPTAPPSRRGQAAALPMP